MCLSHQQMLVHSGFPSYFTSEAPLISSTSTLGSIKLATNGHTYIIIDVKVLDPIRGLCRRGAVLHLYLIVFESFLDPSSQITIESRYIVVEVVCRYD